MNPFRLIVSSLRHYAGKNLLLALGIAISGAVLTGALVVGDSVKYSLNQIVEHRLGEVSHVVKAGDRYFTDALSHRMSAELKLPASPVLLQEASASAAGGQRRVNRVQVLGIDGNFDELAGTTDYYDGLSGDSVIISRNLANRLSVDAGDEVLLRIERASLVPQNAPFVSDADNVVSLRATIRAIAAEEQLGRFNLRVSQTAPFNVFISRQRLEQLMDFSGKVNMILIRGEAQGTADIEAALQKHFSYEDAGLRLKQIKKQQQLELSSQRVFIDDVLNDYLAAAAEKSEARLTYFVNRLQSNQHHTPYSFVSTLPDSWLRSNEVIITSWLADDLGVGQGDSLEMSYFVVGPLRELGEESRSFLVKSVVPMEGRFADSLLMPDLPGLSDAGNCRDWETGVPISLESIRDKDEAYWDTYGGMPKAFIAASRAEELWHNRFGTWTSFRYEAGSLVENELLKDFDPALLGFTVEATREKGMDAAGSGVDFSELFGGLSFFLLVAGILLIVLLFLMNLESRKEQLSTLVRLGLPLKALRRMILGESMLVALVGSLAGILLSVLYNLAVFAALNGVWSDIVRTEMMLLDLQAGTLVVGGIASLLIAFLAIWFPLNNQLKKQSTAHRKKDSTISDKPRMSRKLSAGIAAITGIIALALIAGQLVDSEGDNVAVFFSAGGLLLLSAIAGFHRYLNGGGGSNTATELRQLSLRNSRRNRVRSMSIVILFAIGAFLTISTGSNRKDMFARSMEKSSGTGGFLYFAESTAPVLRQLNDEQVRYDYGMEGDYSLVQLRKAKGDDASCLNLNKIINPQILGVNAAELSDRFSFVTRTDLLDEEQPWTSLDRVLEGGLIPAIADETVIKWGLGLSVGDTLHYVNAQGESMDLLLIGGLAPSIFQGNVLIANEHFLEQFPGSSGTHVFLVEGQQADTAVIKQELGRGLRDLGWDMELSGERLTRFYSVTNTYLAIFMVLGALGLLLGTFGLVVILSRSIMERRQEIALLKAVGYRRRDIRRLVVREYLVLLLAGITTGFISAVVATLPSLLNPNTGTSFSSILLWLLILVLNGGFWIELISRLGLRDESLYQALRND